MSFYALIKAELGIIVRDLDIMLTLFGGIIIYSFFYPQPYLNQSVSDIPTAIVDMDGSKSSRELSFMIDATPDIKVTSSLNTPEEAKEALIRGDIKGFVIIPTDYEKDIYLEKRPTIAVGGDATYFLLMEGVISSASKAVLTNAAQISVVKKVIDGVTIAQAAKEHFPFDFEVINLFNPDNSYKLYVVPAVFVLILQQMFFVGVGLLGANLNEREKRGERGYWLSEPVWKVLFVRLFIFGSLFYIYLLYYFGFSFEFFDIYKLADPNDLLTLAVPYAIASVLLANVIGLLLPQREYVTPTILMTSLPLVFTAVFVWPIQAVPDLFVIISLFFPSNPAILGFIKLNQMGADFAMTLPQYALLWLQVLLYLTLSIYLMRQKRQVIKRTKSN